MPNRAVPGDRSDTGLDRYRQLFDDTSSDGPNCPRTERSAMSKAGAVEYGETAAARGTRLWEVDAARGAAIIMMVVYHLLYDLDTFGGYGIESTSGFWGGFADVTAFMFVFLVGVSLSISSSKARASRSPGRDSFRKYLKRGARILAYGMLITIAFWASGIGGAVIFGILHLIGISIVLAYPFRRLGILNVGLGAVIVALGLYVGAQGFVVEGLPGVLLAPLGIIPADLVMPDYRPLLPWFGVVLFGLFAGDVIYGGERPKRKPAKEASRWSTGAGPLGFLGRHSLFIYLVHQPVLIATLAALGIVSLGL